MAIFLPNLRNEPENPDENVNTLRPSRTPPYETGTKTEPGTEDEPCENVIASDDVTPRKWCGGKTAVMSSIRVLVELLREDKAEALPKGLLVDTDIYLKSVQTLLGRTAYCL